MLNLLEQLLPYVIVWLSLAVGAAAVLAVRRELRLMLRYLYAKQVLLELVLTRESKLAAEFELETHDGLKTVLNAKLADKTQVILTMYDNLSYEAETWNPNSLFTLQPLPIATSVRPGNRVK